MIDKNTPPYILEVRKIDILNLADTFCCLYSDEEYNFNEIYKDLTLYKEFLECLLKRWTVNKAELTKLQQYMENKFTTYNFSMPPSNELEILPPAIKRIEKHLLYEKLHKELPIKTTTIKKVKI